MDWKEKRAEVFATADGFDPTEIPTAIRAAGFTAPDAEIGMEVTASGRVLEEEGVRLFEVAEDERWRLSGELAAEPPATGRVRVRGRFRAVDEGEPPTFEVVEWSPRRLD